MSLLTRRTANLACWTGIAKGQQCLKAFAATRPESQIVAGCDMVIERARLAPHVEKSLKTRLVVPTIKRIPGAYRFFFYSFDCNEPKHVHVQREDMVCKFWLQPVALCRNHGFSPKELNVIRQAVQTNLTIIMEEWDEHCG